MSEAQGTDWGVASVEFDEVSEFLAGRDLVLANEAQTRFDVVDRIIRNVLGWQHGSIAVEDYAPTDKKAAYIDYLLRSGDSSIVIEAKKMGVAFPTPTVKTKLKLNGAVLSAAAIASAIKQAYAYAVEKEADIAVVTNGLCWCFFSVVGYREDAYASLLFPFSKDGHAEQLFELLCADNVSSGSLARITNELPQAEERLLTAFRVADDRIDRNNIADQISPALNRALYAEALLNDPEALRRCFVTTEARTKFDGILGMHLADPKPVAVTPAKRISRSKSGDHLEKIISNANPSYAPPVTLIIGPVGAGKSTYLKHFELVSGSSLLTSKSANWIYVDMEAMGKGGDPRAFMYEKLKNYLDSGMPSGPATYEKHIEPAYAAEIRALRTGPLALLADDDAEVRRFIAERIFDDYKATEPYVDKVVSQLAMENLAVIVLDNIDLYEDDVLESAVFAEGLALSKRVHCHVIVSVRDTTYVRHKNDSAFNAYELRKLWLDPPPLKEVISLRLSYSKAVLKGRSATIDLPNNKHLQVPDLSVFFDIVQQSILRGQAGDYIDAIADLDTRKGLDLVKNFLTSGHIEANRALKQYLLGDTQYYFPFHEIFKGSMLGQWMHFREGRAEGINIFDSRLGSRRLRMLRAFVLQFLVHRAKDERLMEVTVKECCEFMSAIGSTAVQVMSCLEFLNKHRLVRTTTSEPVSAESTIVAARSGGYYARILSGKFVYVEECMYDTAIDSAEAWRDIHDITAQILSEGNRLTRMQKRKDRILIFLQALEEIEDEIVEEVPVMESLCTINKIRRAVLNDVEDAMRKIKAGPRIEKYARGRSNKH